MDLGRLAIKQPEKNRMSNASTAVAGKHLEHRYPDALTVHVIRVGTF